MVRKHTFLGTGAICGLQLFNLLLGIFYACLPNHRRTLFDATVKFITVLATPSEYQDHKLENRKWIPVYTEQAKVDVGHFLLGSSGSVLIDLDKNTSLYIRSTAKLGFLYNRPRYFIILRSGKPVQFDHTHLTLKLVLYVVLILCIAPRYERVCRR